MYSDVQKGKIIGMSQTVQEKHCKRCQQFFFKKKQITILNDLSKYTVVTYDTSFIMPTL